MGLVLTGCWNADCFSSDDSFLTDLFNDAMPVALADGLSWAAVLALTVSPGRIPAEFDRGAEGRPGEDGVYGMFNSKGSLLEIRNGTVRIDVPVIIPDIRERGSRGTDVVIAADLISGEF